MAGVNALGRGQDRESLTQFVGTIAQTMGPEAMAQFLDPGEFIKRLAAAQGIDILNLVKTQEQQQQEAQQLQQAQSQQALLSQAGQLARAPMFDPSKNPNLNNDGEQSNQAPPGQAPQTPTETPGG